MNKLLCLPSCPFKSSILYLLTEAFLLTGGLPSQTEAQDRKRRREEAEEAYRQTVLGSWPDCSRLADAKLVSMQADCTQYETEMRQHLGVDHWATEAYSLLCVYLKMAMC